MPPKPRSAEYFDGWYADRVATPTVDEIMNRHMGFPPDTRAGVVPAEAIPELAEELWLTPGSTLLDLACGRGAYGLLIAQKAGTLLIGVGQGVLIEPPPVLIGQAQASPAHLPSQKAVLLDQVGQRLPFSAIEPAGDDRQ